MHESIRDTFPVPGAGYSQIKNGIYAEQLSTEIFLWYAWINLGWIIFPATWAAFPEACFSHPSPIGNKSWLWWSFLAMHFEWPPFTSAPLLNGSNDCSWKKKHLAHVVTEKCKLIMEKSLPLTRLFELSQSCLMWGTGSLTVLLQRGTIHSTLEMGTMDKDLNQKWITTQWKEKYDNIMKKVVATTLYMCGSMYACVCALTYPWVDSSSHQLKVVGLLFSSCRLKKH